ncbi:hypothetical protein GGI07_004055 [Coemansia sp. Benny D115]|nr:hypothetical protein GGI07_004055 [Coemansia sp. Benny D115]
MDNHRDMVDVLLLPDCNVYERYPELVQRVDYFLYAWTEELLSRTEALLRKQARSLRNITPEHRERNRGGDDEAFTHARSINIAWRQFSVHRLQLPRYPPERINWNKDADPVFLYGQMPALRLEVPWSMRRGIAGFDAVGGGLKPALKRTDLQTYLTSPTLSPVSSPGAYCCSPAMSIRESVSSSSLGSDDTLDANAAAGAASSSSAAVAAADAAMLLKPRLRFNDQVEQCMVVFTQEKEYLPTDCEDSQEEDTATSQFLTRRHKSAASVSKPRGHGGSNRRGRRSLVIKLAPTHLKGDHRKLVSVSSSMAPGNLLHRGGRGSLGHQYFSDEDEYDEDYFDEVDPFGDYAGVSVFGSDYGSRRSSHSSVQKQPSSSSSSSLASGMVGRYVQSVAGQVRKLVSDAVSVSSYSAASASASQNQRADVLEDVVADPFFAPSHRHQNINRHSTRQTKQQHTASPTVASADLLANHNAVVRDPFASTTSFSTQRVSADQVPFDDDEDAIIQEFEPRKSQCHPRQQQQQQQHRPRNDSIIDRAEDTIVNTVDAVKWCASFISNYTIF